MKVATRLATSIRTWGSSFTRTSPDRLGGILARIRPTVFGTMPRTSAMCESVTSGCCMTIAQTWA